jgi:uncharacterized membrane protein YtjA (UPF0391 family)
MSAAHPAASVTKHMLHCRVPSVHAWNTRQIAHVSFEPHIDGDERMLGWALIFFVLALVAGYLGFAGLAGMAASIAQILFWIFLAVLVIGFVIRALRGQSVT